jgi:hypothetical protein
MIVDQLEVAYGAMSFDLQAPGDRRRFAGFAVRNNLKISFLEKNTPKTDVAVLTLGSDISRWKEIKREHGKLVLDVVDSYIDEAAWTPKRLFRGLYKSVSGQLSIPHLRYTELLERVMANADLVVCASLEQKERFKGLNDNVHVIGDCFDELAIDRVEPYVGVKPFDLFWEGMPDNLVHLKLLNQRKNDFNLTVVTSPTTRRRMIPNKEQPTRKLVDYLGVTCSIVPWSVPNLRDVASNSKLAVIPISYENPVAWRKSENKLLGLWSMGVPVLASPTPSYARIIEEASLSECLVKDSDWGEVINEISTDQEKLNQIAVLGHRFAVARTNGIALDKLWKASFASIGLLV